MTKRFFSEVVDAMCDAVTVVLFLTAFVRDGDGFEDRRFPMRNSIEMFLFQARRKVCSFSLPVFKTTC